MAPGCRCWPACLAGRDVKAVAQPGSGKTLGYLLPGAERLRMAGHGAGTQPESPLMLILAPTRCGPLTPLCAQVLSTVQRSRDNSALEAFVFQANVRPV